MITGASDRLKDFPLHPLRKLSPRPSDTSSIDLASEWLSNCLKNHECSTSYRFGSKSPARFIDVGDTTRDPHLVEFPPGKLPDCWVALSYCWGRTQSDRSTNMLRKCSEKTLKQGVELRTFDATIRDAITIARGLRIQHLWVDALCIFQDDESDWLKQSSQMNVIYGNSTLTLVAVDASCVSEGFLKPRYKHYVPYEWQVPGDHDEDCRHHVYLSASWDSGLDRLNGPWSRRGWTLQEGLLPKRTLLYTSDQMVWKCCKDIRYERGVRREPLDEVIRGILDEGGGTDFWRLDLFSQFKLLGWYVQGPGCRPLDDKYRFWHHLIENYSTRNLTQPGDRLVAISGLAKEFGNAIGEEQYFAGLWAQDMVRGLLWRVSGAKVFERAIGNQSTGSAPTAPSWSWASVQSGFLIQNPWADLPGFRNLAKIEEVSVALLEASNPFGDVISGRIRIHGPIFRFSKLYHEDWQSSSAPLSALERHISRIVEHDYSQGAETLSTKGCYAALLMRQAFPSIDHCIDILILQSATPTTDLETSVFERLGLVTIGYVDQDMTASPSLSQLANQQQKSLRRRLNPGKGPRRVKTFHCKDVFQEYQHNRWPLETVTIV